MTTDVGEQESEAPAAQPAREFAPPQATAPFGDAASARTEDRSSAPFRRSGGGGGGGGGRGRFGRRKVCAFCVDKIDLIDYKESHKLRRFLSERGKIEPRRKTGTCARHQRKLTLAIKRARQIALLPYTAGHNFS